MNTAHLDRSVFILTSAAVAAKLLQTGLVIVQRLSAAGLGGPYTNTNNPYSWYIFTEMRPNNLIISSAHNGFWAEKKRRSEEVQAQFGPIFRPSHENANTAGAGC